MTVGTTPEIWIGSIAWLLVTLAAFGVGVMLTTVTFMNRWNLLKTRIISWIPGVAFLTVVTFGAYILGAVAIILAWDNFDSAESDTIYNLTLAFYIGQLIGSVLFAAALIRNQYFGWAVFAGLVWMALVGTTWGLMWFVRMLAFWFYLPYAGWVVLVFIMAIVLYVKTKNNPEYQAIVDNCKKSDDLDLEMGDKTGSTLTVTATSNSKAGRKPKRNVKF